MHTGDPKLKIKLSFTINETKYNLHYNTIFFLQLVWCHFIMLLTLVRPCDTNIALLHKTQEHHKTPLRYSFLKSNSFINILQSFIYGYAIMYFVSVTFQVSLFHAVWRQTINKGEVWRMTVYTTLLSRGREREFHISAPDWPLIPSSCQKSKQRLKVGQSVGWIGVGLAVCLTIKTPHTLVEKSLIFKKNGGPCSPL